MESRLIKRDGQRWGFSSVKEARKKLAKGGKVETHDVVGNDGKKIRVFSERETRICPYCHGSGDIFGSGRPEASVCPDCRGAGVILKIQPPPWEVVEPNELTLF